MSGPMNAQAESSSQHEDFISNMKAPGGVRDKKEMSEEDVKLQFITPAIQSKWGLDRITM